MPLMVICKAVCIAVGNVDNVYELIKVCYHILSSCNHRHVIQLCQIIILDQLMTRIIYFS